MDKVQPPTTPGVQTTTIAPDCRHYRGDRPCFANRLCDGCEHYTPFSHRICVIKLGALGDVIRTLCILPELRRRYPAAQITWVTKANGKRMIEHHPEIDRVLEFDPKTSMVLTQERFDLVVSLDKEPAPAALAMMLRADRKLGIGLSTWGKPLPLNVEAEHYFHLGLSDKLKFELNTKSYLQLVYEALGWTYRGQRYELPVTDEAVQFVKQHLRLRRWNPDRPTVGINVGAGSVFANKMWGAKRIAQLVATLRRRDEDRQFLLLGGPSESHIIDRILTSLPRDIVGTGVIDAGTDHDEKTFIALVDVCDVVFSGDTMAMHVALAREKATVVFFGPTCEQEIDLFGLGEKAVANVPCAPCYKHRCDCADACLEAVSIDAVADTIERVLQREHVPVYSLPVFPSRLAG